MKWWKKRMLVCYLPQSMLYSVITAALLPLSPSISSVGREEGGRDLMMKQWGGQLGVSELCEDQINRDIFIIQGRHTATLYQHTRASFLCIETLLILYWDSLHPHVLYWDCRNYILNCNHINRYHFMMIKLMFDVEKDKNAQNVFPALVIYIERII